jgi:hypothetical protein
MMARARNIKPSFFINEELVECQFVTRLLFIGLWTIADREGRLEDKPKKIKMALFPADIVYVDDSLSDLERRGFVSRYEIDGVKYIQIIAFTKHQNPHKDERPSTIPAQHSLGKSKDFPDENCYEDSANQEKHSASTVQAQCNSDANTVSIGLIPDSLLPIPDCLNPDTPIPSEKHTPLSMLMGIGISKKSAQDWLKVRKSKKLVLTDDALDLFQAECIKANLTPAEAVKICNQESWGGFKADWLNKDSGGNVTQYKSSGQQRIENTNKAVDEFLGVSNKSNIIEGEYQHA